MEHSISMAKWERRTPGPRIVMLNPAPAVSRVDCIARAREMHREGSGPVGDIEASSARAGVPAEAEATDAEAEGELISQAPPREDPHMGTARFSLSSAAREVAVGDAITSQEAAAPEAVQFLSQAQLRCYLPELCVLLAGLAAKDTPGVVAVGMAAAAAAEGRYAS